MKTPRYVVSYKEYQHAELGEDSGYDGWQSFYNHEIYDNLDIALKRAEKCKSDRFKKDVFVAKEIV